MYKTDTNCHSIMTKCDKVAADKTRFEHPPRLQVAENTYQDRGKSTHFRNYEQRQGKCEDHGQVGVAETEIDNRA